MKDEHACHRLELGKRLAAFTTVIRIERQGVADLGENAPEVLARMYVAGGHGLRIGFHRGRKAWQAWAAHAFLTWGHENLVAYREAFRGFRKQEPDEEEFIVETALERDPSQWQAAYDDEVRDWEAEWTALWALYLLHDPEEARKHARPLAEMAASAADLVRAADLMSRVGSDPDETASLLRRAESMANKDWDLVLVADAHLALLGDERRAEEILNTLDPAATRLHANAWWLQALAVCLLKRDELGAAIRDGNLFAFADIDAEDEAAAHAFWNDDPALARRALADPRSEPAGAWDAYFRAQSLVHVLGDHGEAESVLRANAHRNVRREDLYEMAEDWIDDTGDREGARIILRAALPRRVHFRSPLDFLEWADRARRLVGDAAMAEDGIRRAEDRALHDDYYDGMLWDAIARSWIKRGRTDEAVRVLDAGEPNADLRTLAGMAQVWKELGDPARARRCLEKARSKASTSPKFRLGDLCALGPAWMSVLAAREEAESCLREAEEMASGTYNWCDVAEARWKVGDAEAVSVHLRRAAEAATSAWDIRRTVSYGRRLGASREDLLLYLARGEVLSPTSNDLGDMATDYEALGDPAAAERCRRTRKS